MPSPSPGQLAECKEGRKGGGKTSFHMEVWVNCDHAGYKQVLEELLGKEQPKIITRAFRPELPLIMAREGHVADLGEMDKRDLPPLCAPKMTNEWKGILQKVRRVVAQPIFLAVDRSTMQPMGDFMQTLCGCADDGRRCVANRVHHDRDIGDIIGLMWDIVLPLGDIVWLIRDV